MKSKEKAVLKSVSWYLLLIGKGKFFNFIIVSVNRSELSSESIENEILFLLK
jgi:hypothetical protein